MKNNKVLVSLVLASVYAMAGAPEVIAAENILENKLDENKETSKIESSSPLFSLQEIENNTKLANSEETKELRAKMEEDLEAILNKRVALENIYGSVSIVLDNYGSTFEQALKNEVYQDLNLAYGADSTASGNNAGAQFLDLGGREFCHIGCHTACHNACHGSRGWR